MKHHGDNLSLGNRQVLPPHKRGNQARSNIDTPATFKRVLRLQNQEQQAYATAHEQGSNGKEQSPNMSYDTWQPEA